jgi:sortase A
MADRRTIDQLTIEQLEQVLLIKRRQERQERLKQLAAQGRLAEPSPLLADEPSPSPRSPQTAAPVAKRFRASKVRPLSARGAASPIQTQPPSKMRQLRDRLLLGVEVLVLAALMVMGFSFYDTLRALNQEVATARAAPEEVIPPTPTPLVHFDYLPGGHTPPTTDGGTAPDVPAHLQQWVQPAPAQPVPIPGAAKPTRIVVPALDVDAPIVEGVNWEDLKKGVGHLPGSANPGERGNMYLAAHNDIFGEIFRYLDRLELGDEFFVHSDNQVFRYVVTSKRIIEPTDVSVMYPTTEPIATLQTCYPYLIDNQRLVVIGELAN